MYNQRMFSGTLLAFFLVLALPDYAVGQSSDESDGAFTLAENMTLDVSVKSLYNVTTFTIEPGATLTLINGQPGQSFDVHATGAVRIDGAIDAAGQNISFYSDTEIVLAGNIIAGELALNGPQGNVSTNGGSGLIAGGVILTNGGSICTTALAGTCDELILLPGSGATVLEPGGISLPVIESIILSISGYNQADLDALADFTEAPPSGAQNVFPLRGVIAHAVNFIRLSGPAAPPPVFHWQIATAGSFEPAVQVFDRELAGELSDTLEIPRGLLKPDTLYWIRYRNQIADVWSSWSSGKLIRTTSLDPEDIDSNGVADGYQVSGFADTNNNEVDDNAEGIRTVLENAGTSMVGITTGSGDVTAITTLPASIIPVEELSAGSLSYGLFAFSIEGLPVDVTSPASVSVIFYFPEALPADSRWYKFDEASETVLDYTDQVTFSGNTATVRLVDGGPGDSDGLVNGRIVDPGGPGVATGVGGSEGGGCALNVHRKYDGGLLFVLLVSGMSVVWRRKRRSG
ncbi:hypothetical protein MNBD_GAMMA15-427 [hydrothermal vent metagenome]|uniref:Uncharacterized protein n=1 Tax=hydrothermal vent metagenome TaxID=652676 RepID=A0A3B0YLW8_9ZZZZ